MGTKYCKNNSDHPIPESRRTDAIFCTIKCGSTFRNRKNAREKKEMKKNEPGLYENYRVVKKIFQMGIFDITIETAKELGLDFDYHMGVINSDKENKTTKFRLFEYSYTISGNRIMIKKLADECT